MIAQNDQPRAALALDKAAKLDRHHLDLIRLHEALQKLDESSATDPGPTDIPPGSER